MIRRSRWHNAVAALSLLTLLVAVDVCMLVTCAPRANAASRCSHCTTKSGPETTGVPAHGAEANAPCCIQLTIAGAPVLAAPAAQPLTAWAAPLATLTSVPASAVQPRRATDESPPPRRLEAAPRAERGPPAC